MLLFALAIAAASADEKAVRAAEDGWSAAYFSGDGAFLGRLLADDYESVGSSGAAHSKAMILEAARRFALEHPGAKAAPFPPSSTIAISGDLAIVRHHGGKDVSVDIFQKRHGRWIACYSQHTPLAAAG